MKIAAKIWVALFALALTLLPAWAFAQRPLDLSPATNAGLFNGVTNECWKNGTCNFCDGMVVFINVANGILAVLAIVAVIFFVYGAGYLALSSGNENMVQKGKEAIKATIIGTIIVLGAWQLMAIVVLALTNAQGELLDKPATNPVSNWYTLGGKCDALWGKNTSGK